MKNEIKYENEMKVLTLFSFSCLNSSSKDKAAPVDSLVQQIKTNNKPIGKSEANVKWAILFLKIEPEIKFVPQFFKAKNEDELTKIYFYYSIDQKPFCPFLENKKYLTNINFDFIFSDCSLK